MAYSKNTYPGDGATTEFAIEFPYLETDHIGVTVDGIATDFTWANASTVVISPAPALDAAIVISRDSSRADRISSFADQQMLNMSDLNYDALQNFYMAQEAFDQAQATAGGTGGGDMQGSFNLSDVNSPSAARANIGALASTNPEITGSLTLDDAPSDPLHAVTKAYVDAAIAAIPAGTGEVNTATNVGGEAEVFKAKAGVQFSFRTIEAGTGVVVTQGADSIVIDATGVGGGEVNGGANVNVTGLPLYTTKTGVNLQFKGVGAADASVSSASSTAADVLLKVNQAHTFVWTAENKFTGGTAVPTISSALHGVDVAGGALTQVNRRTTRTAPNAVGAMQVQVADLIHVVTGTASTAWEWAQMIILDNYCTTAGTDQVGSYIKAYKRPGAVAHHWGLAIEVSNLATDKTGAFYGAEIRADTNGTELAAKSGPLALFYGSNSGGNSLMDHGLLIENSDGQTGARLAYGIRIEGRPTVAIAQGLQPGGNSGTSMLQAHGNYTGPVLDTAGNAGASCGIRLKSGQAARMSGVDANTRDMVWNSASDTMEFQYGGNVRFEVPLKASAAQNYAFGVYSAGTTGFIATGVTDGAATARNPVGYMRIKVDGTNYRLALYNNT